MVLHRSTCCWFALATAGSVASATHYGDPCSSAGCETGEQAVSVTGLDGSFCSPDCTKAACPTDVPAGATATPQCALTAPSGAKACALICSPTAAIKDQKVADAACGAGASCKPIQGTGICTYDDCGPSPAPTPPPPPTPPPTPLPPGAAQWYMLPFTRTIIMAAASMSTNSAIFPYAANTAAGSVVSGVLKTDDGGTSFTELNVSAGTILESAAAHSETSAVAVGVLGAKYMADGEHFKDAVIEGDLLGAGGLGKARAFNNGKLKYGIAGGFGKKSGSGVAISSTDGLLFKTIDAAGATGLNATAYQGLSASFVTDTTWYVTMGSVPEAPPSAEASPSLLAEGETVVSRLAPRLFVVRNESNGAIAPRYDWAGAAAAPSDATDDAPAPGPDAGYFSAIVKTTDAGATWSKVFQDEGNFQLSGIDCADENHCIAVGDGGSEPPADEYSVIYTTNDGGATWKQTDKQMGGAHCIDVRFVGPSEAWAACYAATDPLHIDGAFKHTTDGGVTWYDNALKGAIVLGFDMFDAHNGWATVFHYATGACGLAKFSTTPPTPPPTPPPSPPRPGQTHYGDPFLGTCESDERNLTVTGAPGPFCAPICTGGAACPKDVPKGVTVDAKCALADQDTGEQNCALICDPYANDKQCGERASCKDLGNGEGVCTYDLIPTPAPTPAPPSPPPVPTPRSPAHYGNPYTGSCLADETNSTTRDDDSGKNMTYNACAPACIKGGFGKHDTCPTDIPPGNTTTFPDAGPRCENFNVPGHPLKHDKHCVLVCMQDTDCPGYHNGNLGSSSCYRELIPVLGHGFCGYVPPGAPSREGGVAFRPPSAPPAAFVRMSFRK